MIDDAVWFTNGKYVTYYHTKFNSPSCNVYDNVNTLFK